MNQKIFNYRKRIQSSYLWIAMVGICVIGLVIAMSIRNYIDFRDSLILREQMQLLTIVESVATGITDFVDKKEEDARILNHQITDQLDILDAKNYRADVIKPIFRNYIEVQKGDVFVVEWLEPDGNMLERLINVSASDFEVETLPDLKIPVHLNSTYVSDVFQGSDEKLYIDILEPVYISNEPIGIVRFVISLDQIYEQYVKDIRAGEKGYASIKDSDGILLMHPKTEDIGTDVMVARKTEFPEYDWSELEGLVDLQKEGKSGVGIYHSIWYHDENKQRIKKFNAFYPAPIGDDFWIVNVSMDYKELVDIVNKHLYTSMIMVGAIPVFFILVSVYVLYLKRNLDQLQIEHNYVERLNVLNRELEDDIEQRKILESALKQSRARFRALFNAGVDLTFVLEKSDKEGLLITEVNETACEKLKISRESLNRSSFMQIDPSMDVQSIKTLIKTMSDNGFVRYETHLKTQSQNEMPVEIYGHLFEFQEKTYIMFIARDITMRLAQTEEVERHRAMAIYKNRMAAVGEMVANIAHQWRQPLSSLNLMLSNLEDAHDTNTLTDDYFNKQTHKAKNVIQKMSQIIDEFRFFFNPKGDKVEFDIRDSVKQVQDMLQDRLRIESVHMGVDIPDLKINVYGYPNQLAQVLLNLVSNALDAFESRSLIDSDAVNMNREINVNASVSDQGIEIRVRDNAGGIESEYLPKLFEPYFTTKSDKGGTGIGLYMSQMIIESKFSGKIVVHQTEEGLEFVISLPTVKQGVS